MAIELPPEGQNPDTEPAPRPAGPEGAGAVEGVIVTGARRRSMAPERLPGQRNDILPPWMRSRAELRAAIAIVGGQQWHRARYHGLRSPVYLLSSVFWALAGLAFLAARQLGWAWMTEALGLQSQAAAAGDQRVWRQMHNDVQETRQTRLTVLAIEGLMIAAGCVALVRLAPWWAQILAVVAALPLLAWIGRPEGKPIISQAIVPPQYEPPTRSLITDALGTLGIPEINKALREGGPGIRFLSDLFRDGPGWTTHLDLPKGVTVTNILAKREELASGLRRPLSATWPGGVPQEHPGRLDLWVGLQDISKTKPPAWPLLKARTVDVFEPVPFGTDPRQRPVTVPVFEVELADRRRAGPGQDLRGARPGLRRGAGRARRAVGARAGRQGRPGAAGRRSATGTARGWMMRRSATPRIRCGGCAASWTAAPAGSSRSRRERRPEGKITPEMALHRHLGLHPLVAFFDEVQNVFVHPEHGTPGRRGRRVRDPARPRLRRDPGPGHPAPRQGIACPPRRDRQRVSCRFCLHVPGQVENDMVLGTSSYKNGYDATMFRAQGSTPGWAG